MSSSSIFGDMVNTVLLTIKSGEVDRFMTMPSNETILQLKKKIETQLGIEVARQKLYSPSVDQMKDSKTVGHYYDFTKLPEENVVRLVVKPLSRNTVFTVNVVGKETRRIQAYQVKETDTVLELKRQILETMKMDKNKFDDVGPDNMKLTRFAEVNDMKHDQQQVLYSRGVVAHAQNRRFIIGVVAHAQNRRFIIGLSIRFSSRCTTKI